MLENDLVLERYLARHGATLSDADVGALDRLLDLTDNELWDLIAGRTETDDPPLVPMAQVLREA